jgi:hypothetical protein
VTLGVRQPHSCPFRAAIDLQPQDHPRLFRQVTRLLDDNNATARPAFRDIALARVIAFGGSRLEVSSVDDRPEKPNF